MKNIKLKIARIEKDLTQEQDIKEYVDIFLLTIGLSIYITINNVSKGLFLTYRNEQERKKVLDSLIAVDEGIRMANDVLCEVTQDDYERAAIFEREKILRDYYAGLANATNKGKREGFDAGLEQGKKLLQEEKMNTARSLKARNFSTEDILEITGLSEDEY